MKRIVLIGIALAGLFTAGITTVASAATTKSIHKTTLTRDARAAAATSTTCKLNLTTVAPPGQPFVVPGTPTGTQWGTSRCNGLNSGATSTTFSTDDAGNLSGKIQHWFRGGTLYGTYTLAPNSASGPPTATSFGAASYTGAVKLSNAQGLLKGTTATGTLNCTTPDSAHFNCTEKLTLTQAS